MTIAAPLFDTQAEHAAAPIPLRSVASGCVRLRNGASCCGSSFYRQRINHLPFTEPLSMVAIPVVRNTAGGEASMIHSTAKASPCRIPAMRSCSRVQVSGRQGAALAADEAFMANLFPLDPDGLDDYRQAVSIGDAVIGVVPCIG